VEGAVEAVQEANRHHQAEEIEKGSWRANVKERECLSTTSGMKASKHYQRAHIGMKQAIC
jgi:hypothetical protein